MVKCEDGWLLYNQIKGSLLLLNDEKAKIYENIMSGIIDDKYHNFIKILEDGGFLKQVGFDEKDYLADVWDKNVNSHLNKSLTIVTTDRCNLGCGYCFEKKTEWRMMKPDVQSKLMSFIKTYLTSTETKSFSVTWFGGEPTLNMSCIENLTEFIEVECKKIGIDWHPYIITNGTTLTPHVVKRLKNCKINKMQITIDGLKDDHDKMRPYLSQMNIKDMNEYQILQREKIDSKFKSNRLLSLHMADSPPENPKSSFDDIMRNIEYCYEAGIDISLRVNVNNINKNRVKDLFDFIQQKGWMNKNADGGVVRVYTHLVFDGCAGNSSSQLTKEEHAEFEIAIDQTVMEKTSESYKKSLRFTGDTCTANKKYQFVINPSGAIIKCWHHATDDSYAIGNITDLSFATSGALNRDRYEFNPLNDQECSNCSVLPICMGGCKANNQFMEKKYEGKHDVGCVSARFTLPQQIKQLYYRMKKR